MKCSQKTCDKHATYSYVWPGAPDRSYACDEHLKKATGISDVMGFQLGDIRHEGAEEGSNVAES